MWRAFNSDGSLTYSFAESVEASYPGYFVRFIGGAIFFSGMLLMAFNVWKTIGNKQPQPQPQNTEGAVHV
jgi:cytochrome c oxidase cbb3-type subunit 1